MLTPSFAARKKPFELFQSRGRGQSRSVHTWHMSPDIVDFRRGDAELRHMGQSRSFWSPCSGDAVDDLKVL